MAAGVARVVSALQDPDPRVAGGGHAILRAAGIAVETGLCAAEAAALNRGFLTRVTQGRPMLTLKLATSLDGRIATASGESRWITGPQARARVHLMRARHDAVLVGGGTARADDARLTVRGLGIGHQPVRVIAAATLDLPQGGALWASVPEAPLWLIHGPAAPEAARAAWAGRGARLFEGATDASGALDPTAMLRALGNEGLTRVFCEGGGALAASLLRADLVDEMAVFSAGLCLGGDARPALSALGLAALVDVPRLSLTSAEALGGDVLTYWTRG